MTAKSDYHKCIECYRESIHRLITGFKTSAGKFIPGVSFVTAIELRAEAAKQVALWGDDAKAETLRHSSHAGRAA